MLRKRSDFEDERGERLWQITIKILMIPVVIWLAIVIITIIDKT